MVDGFLCGGVDKRSQEEIDTLERTDRLEDLDAGRDCESLIILDCHIDDYLEILSAVPEQVLHALYCDGCLHFREIARNPFWV